MLNENERGRCSFGDEVMKIDVQQQLNDEPYKVRVNAAKTVRS